MALFLDFGSLITPYGRIIKFSVEEEAENVWGKLI